MNRNLNKLIKKYRNLVRSNILLNVFSHAPILSFFFNEDLVGEYVVKEGISLAMDSLSYGITLFKKIIYVLLVSSLYELFPQQFLQIFIALTVCGAILHEIISLSMNEYELIMLFRADSRQYVIYQINHYLLTETVLMFLAMLLFHFSFWETLMYLFTYISIHLCAEAVRIFVYEKNEYEPLKGWIKYLAVFLILLINAVLVYFEFTLPQVSVIISLPFMAGADVIAYLYLYQYENYLKLHKYNLTIEKINGAVVRIADYNDRISVDSDRKERKQLYGYDRLNSLFTTRYQKEFKKLRVVLPLLILAVPVVVVVLYLMAYIEEGEIVADIIYSSLGVIIYLMDRIAKNYERYMKLNFMEIDRYMINYSFYRNEQSIMYNLKQRFKTILMYGFPIAIEISGIIALALGLWGREVYSTMNIIAAALLPIVLHVFFCIYYVSLYYLLQPYDFDGRMVNKLYSALTYVIYLVCYFTFYSDIVFSFAVLVIVVVLLAVLSAVLLYLVMKLGSKSFRVK